MVRRSWDCQITKLQASRESQQNTSRATNKTTISPMDKLKGSGNTFSTSGKRWMPFHHNPKLASRFARLHKLKAKGLTPAPDKASLRQLAQQALQVGIGKNIP